MAKTLIAFFSRADENYLKDQKALLFVINDSAIPWE